MGLGRQWNLTIAVRTPQANMLSGIPRKMQEATAGIKTVAETAHKATASVGKSLGGELDSIKETVRALAQTVREVQQISRTTGGGMVIPKGSGDTRRYMARQLGMTDRDFETYTRPEGKRATGKPPVGGYFPNATVVGRERSYSQNDVTAMTLVARVTRPLAEKLDEVRDAIHDLKAQLGKDQLTKADWERIMTGLAKGATGSTRAFYQQERANLERQRKSAISAGEGPRPPSRGFASSIDPAHISYDFSKANNALRKGLEYVIHQVEQVADQFADFKADPQSYLKDVLATAKKTLGNKGKYVYQGIAQGLLDKDSMKPEYQEAAFLRAHFLKKQLQGTAVTTYLQGRFKDREDAEKAGRRYSPSEIRSADEQAGKRIVAKAGSLGEWSMAAGEDAGDKNAFGTGALAALVRQIKQLGNIDFSAGHTAFKKLADSVASANISQGNSFHPEHPLFNLIGRGSGVAAAKGPSTGGGSGDLAMAKVADKRGSSGVQAFESKEDLKALGGAFIKSLAMSLNEKPDGTYDDVKAGKMVRRFQKQDGGDIIQSIKDELSDTLFDPAKVEQELGRVLSSPAMRKFKQTMLETLEVNEDSFDEALKGKYQKPKPSQILELLGNTALQTTFPGITPETIRESMGVKKAKRAMAKADTIRSDDYAQHDADAFNFAMQRFAWQHYDKGVLDPFKQGKQKSDRFSPMQLVDEKFDEIIDIAKETIGPKGGDRDYVRRILADSFPAMVRMMHENPLLLGGKESEREQPQLRLAAEEQGQPRGQIGALPRLLDVIHEELKLHTSYLKTISEIHAQQPSVTGGAKKPKGLAERGSFLLDPGARTPHDNRVTQPQRFASAIDRVSAFGGAAAILYGGASELKTGFKLMVDFEKGVTNVRKVMNPLGADFRDLGKNAREMGQDLGKDLVEVTSGMAAFASQGQSMKDVLTNTRTALMATNVTTMELGEAVDFLTSAQKQYQMTASQGMRILDAWNEIENTTGVSVKVLGDAMKRAGTASRLAGVDFDTFTGLTAALAESTRKNGEMIGTSLKFMFQHVKDPKAIESLERVGVYIQDSAGNMKNARQSLGELAKMWPKLTDAQRENVAISVAGTEHLNDFMVAMEQWDRAMDLTVTSLTSQGSAQRENNILMETTAKKVDQVKAAWQGLWATFGETGALDVVRTLITQVDMLLKGVAKVNTMTGGLAGGMVGTFGAAGIALGGVSMLSGGVIPGIHGWATGKWGGTPGLNKPGAMDPLTRHVLENAALEPIALGAGRAERSSGASGSMVSPMQGMFRGARRYGLLGMMVGAGGKALYDSTIRQQKDGEMPSARDTAVDMGSSALTTASLIAMIAKPGAGIGGQGKGRLAAMLLAGLGGAATMASQYGAHADPTREKANAQSLDAIRQMSDRVQAARTGVRDIMKADGSGTLREDLDASKMQEVGDMVAALAPGIVKFNEAGEVMVDNVGDWAKALDDVTGSLRTSRTETLKARLSLEMNSKEVEEAVEKRSKLVSERYAKIQSGSMTKEGGLDYAARIGAQNSILRDRLTNPLRAAALSSGMEGGGYVLQGSGLKNLARQTGMPARTLQSLQLQGILQGATGSNMNVDAQLKAAGVDAMSVRYAQYERGGAIHDLTNNGAVAAKGGKDAEAFRKNNFVLSGFDQQFMGGVSVTAAEKLNKLVSRYEDAVERLTAKNDDMVRSLEFLNKSYEQSAYAHSLEGLAGSAASMGNLQRTLGTLATIRGNGGGALELPSKFSGPYQFQRQLEMMIGQVTARANTSGAISPTEQISIAKNSMLATRKFSQEFSKNVDRLIQSGGSSVDRAAGADESGMTAADYNLNYKAIVEAVGQRDAELLQSMATRRGELVRDGGSADEIATLTKQIRDIANGTFSQNSDRSVRRIADSFRGELDQYTGAARQGVSTLGAGYRFARAVGSAGSVDQYLQQPEVAKQVSGLRETYEAMKQFSKQAQDAADEVGRASGLQSNEYRTMSEMAKQAAAATHEMGAGLNNLSEQVNMSVEGMVKFQQRVDRIASISGMGGAFGQTGIASDQHAIDYLTGAIEKLYKEMQGAPDEQQAKYRERIEELNRKREAAQQDIAGRQDERGQLSEGLMSSILSRTMALRMGMDGGAGGKPYIDSQLQGVQEMLQRVIRQVNPKDFKSFDDVQGFAKKLEDAMGDAGKKFRDIALRSDTEYQKNYLLASPSSKALMDNVREMMRSGASAQEIMSDPYLAAAARQEPGIQSLLDKALQGEQDRAAFDLQKQMVDISKQGNGYLKGLYDVFSDYVKQHGGTPADFNTFQKNVLPPTSQDPTEKFASGTMAKAGNHAVDAQGRIRHDETYATLHKGEVVLNKQEADALLGNAYAKGTMPRSTSRKVFNATQGIVSDTEKMLADLPDATARKYAKMTAAMSSRPTEIPVKPLQLASFNRRDPRPIISTTFDELRENELRFATDTPRVPKHGIPLVTPYYDLAPTNAPTFQTPSLPAHREPIELYDLAPSNASRRPSLSTLSLADMGEVNPYELAAQNGKASPASQLPLSKQAIAEYDLAFQKSFKQLELADIDDSIYGLKKYKPDSTSLPLWMEEAKYSKIPVAHTAAIEDLATLDPHGPIPLSDLPARSGASPIALAGDGGHAAGSLPLSGVDPYALKSRRPPYPPGVAVRQPTPKVTVPMVDPYDLRPAGDYAYNINPLENADFGPRAATAPSFSRRQFLRAAREMKWAKSYWQSVVDGGKNTFGLVDEAGKGTALGKKATSAMRKMLGRNGLGLSAEQMASVLAMTGGNLGALPGNIRAFTTETSVTRGLLGELKLTGPQITFGNTAAGSRGGLAGRLVGTASHEASHALMSLLSNDMMAAGGLRGGNRKLQSQLWQAILADQSVEGRATRAYVAGRYGDLRKAAMQGKSEGLLMEMLAHRAQLASVTGEVPEYLRIAHAGNANVMSGLGKASEAGTLTQEHLGRVLSSVAESKSAQLAKAGFRGLKAAPTMEQLVLGVGGRGFGARALERMANPFGSGKLASAGNLAMLGMQVFGQSIANKMGVGKQYETYAQPVLDVYNTAQVMNNLYEGKGLIGLNTSGWATSMESRAAMAGGRMGQLYEGLGTAFRVGDKVGKFAGEVAAPIMAYQIARSGVGAGAYLLNKAGGISDQTYKNTKGGLEVLDEHMTSPLAFAGRQISNAGNFFTGKGWTSEAQKIQDAVDKGREMIEAQAIQMGTGWFTKNIATNGNGSIALDLVNAQAKMAEARSNFVLKSAIDTPLLVWSGGFDEEMKKLGVGGEGGQGGVSAKDLLAKQIANYETGADQMAALAKRFDDQVGHFGMTDDQKQIAASLGDRVAALRQKAADLRKSQDRENSWYGMQNIYAALTQSEGLEKTAAGMRQGGTAGSGSGGMGWAGFANLAGLIPDSDKGPLLSQGAVAAFKFIQAQTGKGDEATANLWGDAASKLTNPASTLGDLLNVLGSSSTSDLVEQIKKGGDFAGNAKMAQATKDKLEAAKKAEAALAGTSPKDAEKMINAYASFDQAVAALKNGGAYDDYQKRAKGFLDHGQAFLQSLQLTYKTGMSDADVKKLREKWYAERGQYESEYDGVRGVRSQLDAASQSIADLWPSLSPSAQAFYRQTAGMSDKDTFSPWRIAGRKDPMPMSRLDALMSSIESWDDNAAQQEALWGQAATAIDAKKKAEKMLLETKSAPGMRYGLARTLVDGNSKMMQVLFTGEKVNGLDEATANPERIAQVAARIQKQKEAFWDKQNRGDADVTALRRLALGGKLDSVDAFWDAASQQNKKLTGDAKQLAALNTAIDAARQGQGAQADISVADLEKQRAQFLTGSEYTESMLNQVNRLATGVETSVRETNRRAGVRDEILSNSMPLTPTPEEIAAENARRGLVLTDSVIPQRDAGGPTGSQWTTIQTGGPQPESVIVGSTIQKFNDAMQTVPDFMASVSNMDTMRQDAQAFRSEVGGVQSMNGSVTHTGHVVLDMSAGFEGMMRQLFDLLQKQTGQQTGFREGDSIPQFFEQQ